MYILRLFFCWLHIGMYGMRGFELAICHLRVYRSHTEPHDIPKIVQKNI